MLKEPTQEVIMAMNFMKHQPIMIKYIDWMEENYNRIRDEVCECKDNEMTRRLQGAALALKPHLFYIKNSEDILSKYKL